jgi:small subunit ribosomal protein S4
MSRYTGPKNKQQRRIGEDLGLKTNAVKVARVINSRPGQHGAKNKRKLSDFGTQLKEKQKLKYVYGVNEKQLHHLYELATKNPTATGAALLNLLERRLDNVVYRLGWVGTRAAARQLVSHNHVLVNGKKMNIPSYTVDVNDVITIKSNFVSSPAVAARLKEENNQVPAWLERKGAAGKVVRYAERAEIREAIEESLIVEYYSR